MNKTKIEWVKNPDGTQGYTWNPITGCLNGCEYCYARKLANGRLKPLYLANPNVAWTYEGDLPVFEATAADDPFYPRFWEDRLWLPRHYRQPKGIFPCDMSDLFGIGIPEEWTMQILRICQLCSWHRFYLLTKQPQNLIKFSPFPPNCFVGVTATNQKAHNEAVVVLASIEASIKFISHEPLLEHISLHPPYSPEDAYDWDIIGSQTKPYKPPKIEWVEEIVRACDKARIPAFLKNNLMPLFDYPQPPFFKKPSVNDTLKLRQEMPKVR